MLSVLALSEQMCTQYIVLLCPNTHNGPPLVFSPHFNDKIQPSGRHVYMIISFFSLTLWLLFFKLVYSLVHMVLDEIIYLYKKEKKIYSS